MSKSNKSLVGRDKVCDFERIFSELVKIHNISKIKTGTGPFHWPRFIRFYQPLHNPLL